jgi:release factor glutamine methyltransferase
LRGREAFLLGVRSLKDSVPTPERETSAILAHILGLTSSSQVLLQLNSLELTSVETQVFHEMVRRRSRQEPLAYILGFETFFERRFKVDSSVLIPRPETEFLMQEFLERIPRGESCKILDLCTGSGVLAITALLERPGSLVFGLDRSLHALKTASENARLHHCKIDFAQADLLRGLKSLEQFDVVLCNPPYLPSSLSKSMQPDVLDYEPHLALFSGNQGLDLIRLLLTTLPPVLSPQGILVLECGQNQSKNIQLEAKKAGLKALGIKTDYRGIERILTLGL